jgi:hypothetical protein
VYRSLSALHFGATWWRNFGNPITSLYVFMENQFYNVKQSMKGINIGHGGGGVKTVKQKQINSSVLKFVLLLFMNTWFL